MNDDVISSGDITGIETIIQYQTTLPVGVYNLILTVYDSSGNKNNSIITITILEIELPTTTTTTSIPSSTTDRLPSTTITDPTTTIFSTSETSDTPIRLLVFSIGFIGLLFVENKYRNKK